ncbi:hypothetical protein PhiH1_245 [Halobacterium phage phiH]|uniref:Uncharacterized protein n=1 Tax=Halobacterium phage phiH TaxID=169684 RepID=A0A3G1ZKU8_BPPHH|nr:hypothetical protein [Halobacterium salinarum]YP_009981855.1 hypothetical protein JR051_gp50 [Halobacterium phage phiH]AYM00295.1 hypothetical protein PhiH1_245 [Halobacterium phage phiH]
MKDQKTDPEETTSQFMHALAAAEVDAANISAERSDDPDILTVTSLIEPADIEDASEIAGEHDFTEQQRGEIVNGRETVTYKLEA